MVRDRCARDGRWRVVGRSDCEHSACGYRCPTCKRWVSDIASDQITLFVLAFSRLSSRWHRGNGCVYFAGPPIMLMVVALAWTMTLREIPMRISTSLVLIACAIGIKLTAGAAWIWSGRLHPGLYETGGRPATVSLVLSRAILYRRLRSVFCASGCAAYPVNASCISTPWTPSAEALAYLTQLILPRPVPAKLAGYGTIYFRDYSDLDLTRQKWCLCRDFGIFGGGARHCSLFLKGRFSNAPRHENLIWPLYIAVIGTIYWP